MYVNQFKCGLAAQSGEQFPCTEKVAGSMPVRSTKTQEPLTQLVECLPYKQDVLGSSPRWLTTLLPFRLMVGPLALTQQADVRFITREPTTQGY